MSLSSDISTTSTALSDIKTAIINKGITPSGNITTYASAISQISGGGANIDSLSITPTTSSQTITASGGVDGYSPVNVSAVTSSIDANIQAGNIKDGVTILGVTGNYTGSGGGSTKFGLGIDSFIGNIDGNGVLSAPSSINGITFTGLVEVGNSALKFLFHQRSFVGGTLSFPDLITVRSNGLYEAFRSNAIASVDLSALTTVDSYGLSSSFAYNSITSVDLSALTTVGSHGLYEAFESNYITSVDLSALTTVGSFGLYVAFVSNAITSVDLSALTSIGEEGLSETFSDNQITSVSFPALTSIGMNGLVYTFSSNATLQTVSFPALTSNSFESDDESAFDYMLMGDEDVTVHFPSNLQSVIGNWQSVSDGFDGTNTTILFDLPATE